MTVLKKDALAGTSGPDGPDALVFYDKEQFHRMLRLERKRTDRSRVPFLLMLADLGSLTNDEYQAHLAEIKSIICSSLRETDVKGWYSETSKLGVIFTEMVHLDEKSKNHIFGKLWRAFEESQIPEIFRKIKINFHLYPEEYDKNKKDCLLNPDLYPDRSEYLERNQISQFLKRSIDVLGSSIFILLFSPVFLIVALTIKLTSPGPVLFRQERLGLNGKKFMFLKFRSMYADNDPRSHREYVRNLIVESKNGAGENGVYKITDDPRVTPFGRFLRRSSLDEIPQFINVLAGDMSLVGPRPPIPYECEMYETWHRRRLLSYRPGITGLWQVTGRSATTFDEMVRLDLDYIENWNLWEDIKILFKTPIVVLTGKGAY